MKTLYISDLDGTLLNENKELSSYSINTLNNLISRGMNFSVATARTNATVSKMLSQVNIDIPVILMNGVLIYNLQAQNYIQIQHLNKHSIDFIIASIKNYGTSGFMYGIQDDKMSTYYENLSSDAMKDFYEERSNGFNKQFTHLKDFTEAKDKGIMYFALMDTENKLLPLYNTLIEDTNIKMEFYHDIYDENLWYLEIFSNMATKYNAVSYLRSEYNFDKIIGFGDNLNDIPLFKGCDESYAVENAHSQVKAYATGVIQPNKEDGVVKYLEDLFSEIN